jgi:type IV secretory pathway VirB2 component (pilin)
VHHPTSDRPCSQQILLSLLLIIFVTGAPDLAMAQASPFMTGATSLQTNLLAWLTPVAVILVMVLGGMAMANRMGLISGVEHLLDPCKGEIRWRSGDAYRWP